MMDFTVIVYLIKAHQMRFYLNHRIIELPMKSFLLQILKRIGIILLAALVIGLFGSFLATVYRQDLSPWLPFAVSLLSAFSISFWMVMLSFYERNSWNEYVMNLDEHQISLVSRNYMLFLVWGMLLNLFCFSAVQINHYVLSNHDSFHLSIMMNVMVLFAKVLF
ncbi:MAG: hypothetical protein PHP32_04380, partial [Candidatus Izemoplasmatales bacterium]|nr:hypothetical protein [Candidatus Izemoplasmatales bacterium]